jgi:hypothetical protein
MGALSDLRGKLERMTERPWKWEEKDGSLRAHGRNAVFYPKPRQTDTIRDLVNHEADAEGIVALVNQADALLEAARALGPAIEELERRHPLDADPLTSAVISDGRAALAALEEGSDA